MYQMAIDAVTMYLNTTSSSLSVMPNHYPYRMERVDANKRLSANQTRWQVECADQRLWEMR